MIERKTCVDIDLILLSTFEKYERGSLKIFEIYEEKQKNIRTFCICNSGITLLLNDLKRDINDIACRDYVDNNKNYIVLIYNSKVLLENSLNSDFIEILKDIKNNAERNKSYYILPIAFLGTPLNKPNLLLGSPKMNFKVVKYGENLKSYHIFNNILDIHSLEKEFFFKIIT